MRSPRLPPLDTSGYISCPIDTPLFDFDQKSPVPCIIVTPSSPTEYHIAFHHKSSPLKHASFAAQQQQPRTRRALLSALNPFVDTTPPTVSSLEVPARHWQFKARTRTALVLAIPMFVIACHILVSSLLRSAGLGSSLFGGAMSHGGFSSAAAHMRAQREAKPEPELPVPAPVPAPVPIPTPQSERLVPSQSADSQVLAESTGTLD